MTISLRLFQNWGMSVQDEEAKKGYQEFEERFAKFQEQQTEDGKIKIAKLDEEFPLQDRILAIERMKAEKRFKKELEELEKYEFSSNINQNAIHIPNIKIPSATDFLKLEFGDTDWLIQDLIPSGGSGIIVAKRESFKTWLALYLSKCVSQGLPLWDIFSTSKSKVLYITNDDPARSFQKRLGLFHFDNYFFIYHPALPDFSIEQSNGSFEAAMSLVAEEKIGLVVVDILRNTHDKDSNTDKDSKLVIGKFKELRRGNQNLSLIFLIHPSKEHLIEKRFGSRQSEEAVGSYYWEAAVDTVISLSKTTEGDLDQVVINITKNKQSEKKIKPFIGIRRRDEGPVEFIYEEKIPDKLKIAQAKEYIIRILTEKERLRQEIIDFCVADQICGDRTAEEALKELFEERQVDHGKTKPHLYWLIQNQPDNEDSANRNSIYDLRNAESPTLPPQIGFTYTEETND